MNALLPTNQGPLSLAPFTPTQSVSDRLAPEPAIDEMAASEFSVSEEELNELLTEFAAHCEKLDHHLTEQAEEECYKRFFQSIKQALLSVGTFSQCGAEDEDVEDPDFTSSSEDDPSRVIRVKTRVPVTLDIAQTVLDACTELGSEHAVLFSGKEGRCAVFSNGDFCREEE
jgi:hypothetical protein